MFFLNIKPLFHRRKLHKICYERLQEFADFAAYTYTFILQLTSCGMYIVRCLINNSVHLTVNYAQLCISTMCNSVNCITLSNTQLCACFNLFWTVLVCACPLTDMQFGQASTKSPCYFCCNFLFCRSKKNVLINPLFKPIATELLGSIKSIISCFLFCKRLF